MNIVYFHTEKQFQNDLPAFLRANRVDVLTYANAKYQFVAPLEDVLGFHVIRDPRDIAVSSYFSHRYSHPNSDWPHLSVLRERLERVSKEEGLILDLDFIDRDVFQALETWDYRQPRVLELRMEDLAGCPREGFLDVFRFLGIMAEGSSPNAAGRLPPEALDRILEACRFEVLSGGRRTGEEDSRHHFRKGVPGDWRNHFTPAVKDYFKRRYARLLIRLGYEKDDAW